MEANFDNTADQARATGRRLKNDLSDGIGDIKNAGIDRATGTELFVPYQQYPFTFGMGYLAIKTQGDPLAMVRPVQSQVRALDASLPVSSVSWNSPWCSMAPRKWANCPASRLR